MEVSPEIYPNPASDQLILHVDIAKYYSCTLSNNLGQILSTQNLNSGNTNVDIKSLIPGVYYISLKGAEGGITRTFVKK